MAILRCHVIVNEVGTRQYVPFAVEDEKAGMLVNDDNTVAFNRFPNGETVDLRTRAPFLQIIPCPYCGTDDNRTHDPLQHVDPRLGTPIAEVDALARQLAASQGCPDKWQQFTVRASNLLLDKPR